MEWNGPAPLTKASKVPKLFKQLIIQKGDEFMKKISTLGIDLAKNSFQVCAMDENGKVLFNKKLKRDQFLSFTINLDWSAVV